MDSITDMNETMVSIATVKAATPETTAKSSEAADVKKQLLIFLLVAFGVTYAMGLLIWYGSTISAEMSAFPNAQMFFPAAGVMLAYLTTRWKDSLLPRWFYLCFLIVTILMLLCAVGAVAMPGQTMALNGQEISLWAILSQYVMIGGTILCWIALLASGKKRRAAYGLHWQKGKASLFCILVFIVLYFGRAALAYIIGGVPDAILEIAGDPAAWIYLLITPLNFVLAFAPFLGEEYGWRYYLQPMMQKRFGLRRGVLLLGVAWGLWHFFLDFFFYTTPDRGLIMTVSQIITCVTLGILFAWAYMKTDNIWVPVIMHFLNNNLSPVIAGAYSAEVMQNQQVTWGMIPSSLLINGILFGLFLLAKEFRKSPCLMQESMLK